MKNGAQFCPHCGRVTLQMFSPPGWLCSECARPTYTPDGKRVKKGASK